MALLCGFLIKFFPSSCYESLVTTCEKSCCKLKTSPVGNEKWEEMASTWMESSKGPQGSVFGSFVQHVNDLEGRMSSKGR